MNFSARIKQDGSGLEVEERFKEWARKHGGVRLVIETFVPESRKQRRFYHGAVIPLWIYLDGGDYKSSEKQDQYHEVAKREFNGEIVRIGKKMEKVGKSTKGLLNKGFLERVIDFLVENYAVNQAEVLNPKDYNHFKNKIYMDGEYDDYIDYLKVRKLLK